MDWTKVITHPLGLSGFALFLVFGYLGTRKSTPALLLRVSLAMGLLSLVGGLALAYFQARVERTPRTAPELARPTREGTQEVSPTGPTATASGNCATAVAGTIAASGAVAIGGCDRRPADAASSAR